MGNKLLLAGNITALIITLAAFLQVMSWPIAGVLILLSLAATMFLHVNQTIRLNAQQERPEAEPLSKPSVKSPRKVAPLEEEQSKETLRSTSDKTKTSFPKPSVPKASSLGPVEPVERPGENTIGEGDYITFDLDLDEGKEVVAEVSATGDVNAYILTEENVTALDLDQEFWYEAGSEGVQKATLRFVAPEEGKWFLLVENDSTKDVTATVKISIRKVSQPIPSLKTESLDLPDAKLSGRL